MNAMTNIDTDECVASIYRNGGISLELILWDESVIKLCCTCSNARFAGTTNFYATLEDLANLVETLRGFPVNIADTRVLELGSLSPKFAEGGVLLQFRCRDAAGHAVVEAKMRTQDCEEFGALESVAMRIPIEAAGLDTFLAEVRSLAAFIEANPSGNGVIPSNPPALPMAVNLDWWERV